MIITARRTAAAIGAAAVLLISAPVAHADQNYPPTVPDPTVSGIKVGHTPTIQHTRSPQASALPRTGADVIGWGLAGSALLVGGAGLVVVTRRRGRHA